MRRNLRSAPARVRARSVRSSTRAAVLAAAVAGTLGSALAACGGGGAGGTPAADDTSGGWLAGARQQARNDTATVRCAPGTDDAVTLAVTAFVKQAQPRPQRFLVAAGSDSALPEAGLKALQDRGPTYLFPAAPALQQQVRTLLHEKGDYTTLLVVLRERARRDSTVNVTVDGHYVGGEEEGRTAGAKRFVASCANGKWTLGPAAATRGT